ncbi:putative integral membrane protein [Aspergillus ruber CBS 135680]|uniref:Putative integral membrane protein n=1 Tax=Aspergillus ruber (strain CBS 135680) TaxID=1388766 RepID=A0A017S012_ASPRC|nr:putative integral membrane protein [Aspergillus ruber CBS 135680]EYE90282.1 putative integral membrane protein [Aspergillus ruber CBS 135680]
MVSGRSEVMTIVTAVFFGISLTTVLTRCFVRLRVVRAFGWDDTLMVIAMIMNTGFAICGFFGAYYGIGKRLEYFLFHSDSFHKALFCWWLGQVFYIITCIVAKTSIILSLLRITVNRIHIVILYAAMALNMLVGVLFFFFTIFQCTPVSHFWNRLDLDSGKCIDVWVLIDIAYLYSVGAAITDFTIGILPAFMIWNLRMSRRDKIAVIGVLSLGCIASAAVIVRIPYIQHYADRQFLYKTINIAIWSNIEGGLGITAGSLTTLRPLIRFFREASTDSHSYSRNPGSYPLSSTLGNNTPYQQSKLEQEHDDAQHLWPGNRDAESFGVRTVVLGNGRIAAAPAASSSEEELNPHAHTVMGSRELGRMRKG